ncbi:trans-aconitate methyltransferase [Streptomyces sp. CB00455]|uniref:methyltransferase domain-containing protein n=1 Tax=Streptomyces sp. CB00455 TaxID=1703927 RepID=UPI000940243A|nr:methyltransferase domain-containing protein [Streptomyces sp. CB00455]OKK17575.1 trans-aconitate methyltransferase [Streptomyces sp. CB00455]
MRTSPVWNPEQYGKYADERGRPFADLLARVRAEEPSVVVDLGCGPGNLTATLRDRWPTAAVHGVDSSPEMIDAARPLATDRLTFEVGDLRAWAAPPESVDVIVSNATLQWVPEQLDLLPGFVRALRPGGWLALQIPGNGDAPSHAILRELAGAEPYAPYAGEAAPRPDVPGPAQYVAALSAEGCSLDAWESTYSHLLPGENAVLEWVKGTGARPVLQSLPDGLRERFEVEYGARLAVAYPRRSFGTLLPFRRVFAVARKER